MFDPRSGSGFLESVSPRLLARALVLLTLGFPGTLDATAQDPLERARQAVEEGDYFRVIAVLTPEIDSNPSAEVYLRLGVAHANTAGLDRALELFEEGARLYPANSRFHDEIAGVHLANRDVDLAVEALDRALVIDPGDLYASDLLASIRLSEGDVQEALSVWNAVNRPEIDTIVQNFSPGFLDGIVPRSLAFEPGDVLDYGQWRTTQSRLFTTQLYSNVGLELEPSPAPDRYDAIVRTSPFNNSRQDMTLDLLRGLPVETVYFELWDIGRSGISWSSNFRWDEDRRRLEGRLFLPLPLPGVPLLEIGNTWRSEHWNLSEPIRDAFLPDAGFEYKVNGISVALHAVPHYRLELRGGFEYRNRDVTGRIAGLGMDERNSATFGAGAVIRTLDGRYKNQIRLDGFLASDSVLSDFDFRGGSGVVANRFIIDSERRVDFSLSGGTLRGDAPIDYYHILGLGDVAQHRLRGHVSSHRGVYGRSPMGTDFVLINTDIQQQLATIPLFNTLSIPYIELKAMGFFDAAKTFDRNRIFEQGVWYTDAGAGLRFEVPTLSFTLLYGRDIEGGVNNFYFYSEPRLW